MSKQPFREKSGRQPSATGTLCILILSWEYPPQIIGGLSRHVKGISSALAKMGHAVHVITAGIDGVLSDEKVEGVWVHRVRPLNEYADQFLSYIGSLNLAMFFKAEQLAETIEFSLVHAHDWLVGAAAAVLKESLSIPLLATIHATEYGRNNGIYTEMQKFIHRKEEQLIAASNQIIVCSEYMKEQLAGHFEVAGKKITVIPNGIDEQKMDINASQLFPTVAGKKLIFSLGRIVPEKGFKTLIQAASLAKDKRKDIYIVIGGRGPLLDYYRQQIREQDLGDYIEFIGYLNDQQRNALLQKCEMAVFPSLYEPFGIVALESMILGKPTIVSNTGGLSSIIKHMETGLLMEPGSPECLLEQIGLLLENRNLAIKIGELGKQMVKSKFSWERIAAETAGVMKSVLQSFQKSH